MMAHRRIARKRLIDAGTAFSGGKPHSVQDNFFAADPRRRHDGSGGGQVCRGYCNSGLFRTVPMLKTDTGQMNWCRASEAEYDAPVTVQHAVKVVGLEKQR
jgi:hypothetical protein